MDCLFTIQKEDTLFSTSPQEGDADCLCSRCGGLIPRDTIALRAFVNQGRGGEYRYCDYCQEQAGIWSHEHAPVIVHRTGGLSAAQMNACGECGQRIVKVEDKWRLAPPDQYFRRAIVKRVACTDGTEEVTLDCQHTIVRVIPQPEAVAMDCPECVNRFVEEHREAT